MAEISSVTNGIRTIEVIVSEASEAEISNFVHGHDLLPREIAGIILGEVAAVCPYGGCPERTPFEVGRALGRIMPNHGLSNAENIAEIVKGYCYSRIDKQLIRS